MAIRPLLIWGLDKTADKILKDFRLLDASVCKKFVPETENPLREFKETIINFRDLVKSLKNFREPGVVLFLSSFIDESIGYFDFIKKISQTIKVTLPGSQSISLIIFFPHQTADDQKKLNTYKFFLQMENWVWDIPFLDIVFVNQLPKEMHDYLKEEANPESALYKLLYCQLQDMDLNPVIEGFGYPSIRNRDTDRGRKFIYSTTGSYQLIYYADECMKYLKARLQKEIFERIFFQLELIEKDKKCLELIQKRSDQFVENRIENSESKILKLEKVSTTVSGQAPMDDAAPDWVYKFKKEVKEATAKIESDSAEWTDKFKDIVNEEFQGFLNEAPGYLAGARFFVDSLCGRQLVPGKEDESILSGVKLFENEFCVLPFCNALKELYHSVLSQFDESQPQFTEQNSKLPWLNQFASHAENEMHRNLPFIVRVIYQSVDPILNYVETKQINVLQMNALMSHLIAVLGQELDHLNNLLERNREERASAEKMHEDLRRKMGFFSRFITRRSEYNRAVQTRNKIFKELDDKLEKLLLSGSTMKSFFEQLFNQALLPHFARVMFNQHFHKAAENLKYAFLAFINDIDQYFTDQWNAVKITEFESATGSTILNQKKLDILYRNVSKILSDKDPGDQVLMYIPIYLPETEVRKLPYYKCCSLKDHYLSGSVSLSSRIEHFAIESVKPVQNNNALDILELEGRNASNQYLKDTLEKLNKFIDFSPGFLPIVEQSKKMNSMIASRTHKDINTSLEEDYGHLFIEGTQFFNTSDPFIIDLKSMYFGFPAFLIHGLSECRELSMKQEKSVNGDMDLWPEAIS